MFYVKLSLLHFLNIRVQLAITNFIDMMIIDDLMIINAHVSTINFPLDIYDDIFIMNI